MTNLQGDVVAILNSAGTAVVQYTYDAWGNILSIGGELATTLGVLNPLRYRGYVYDSETKLYYLQSRYYDPQVGRFINADGYTSTGQGILGSNMFVYCGNNPVVRVDIGGLRWIYRVEKVETIAKDEDEDEDDRKTYVTTIIYTKTDQPMFGCTAGAEYASYKYEVSFEFTVSNDGAISFSNEQNSAKHIAVDSVRSTLAREMDNVCKEQVSGSLSGRTVSGIDSELFWHYWAFANDILSGPASVANIGGTDLNKPGYDSNGWYFEAIFGWF